MVITNPLGSVAQDERAKGFEEVLKKATGITYLGAQYQNDDPQRLAEIVTSSLSADLADIFSASDQGAILIGLRQAGAIRKVKLIPYESAAAEVAALKNDQISVVIAQDPKREGEMAVEIAKKLPDGQPLDNEGKADTVAVKASETTKAGRYERKGDCSMSY